MTKDYQSAYESPWKWLSKKWEFDVPKDTTVVTNLQALKGEPVTEIMRWEEDEWEMFAGPGPENEEKDIRIVPIGLLLSIDDSIKECLNLEIGKGIWRETMESTWKNWG